MHTQTSCAPHTGIREKWGSGRGRQAEPEGTYLQGISKTCLFVLDAAHEQETEGLLCDRMSFMNHFLGEGMRWSCWEPAAEPSPARRV